MSILVAPARGTIGLSIENLTEHSLQVLWNEASFVGVDGLAGRVVPGTTLVMDMQREQAPTVVPAKSRIVTAAIPNEYYSRSSYGSTIRDFVCVGEPYPEIEGKEARLILPLRVLDVTNEYTFVFKVQDIVAPPRPTSTSHPDRSESCIS